MKYKLIIFDMDGTILDTLEDLADSTNYALDVMGYPARTIDEVRSFVGNGIGKLLERSAPDSISTDDLEKLFAIFNDYYKKNSCNKTRPYDGILSLLKELRSQGIKTAVVSNKADYAVQDLCIRFFDGLFDVAIGEKTGVRRKPAPDSVYAVLNKLKISKEEAVYVGDSDVDILTAANAGMDCICVSWGFRDEEFLKKNGADVVIQNPSEITHLL